MVVDYFCAVFLIFAVSAIMLRAFNKAGYYFTFFDWLMMAFLGVLAFTGTMGITYFVFWLIR